MPTKVNTQSTKKVKKESKIDEAISHILGVLDSIEDRLNVLESDSHEPIPLHVRESLLSFDFESEFDDIDSRLSKVEGRMGL